MMKFHDRTDAGKQLAEALDLSVSEESVVLALPRGGIPLGIIIAEKYDLPFDTIQSKKIGHPHHSEYAIGAVSEEGDPLLDDFQSKRLDEKWLNSEIGRLRKKMADRRETYAKVLKKQSLKDGKVIIVDDGVATGMTVKAAIKAVKAQGAREIIIAVPIVPQDTYRELMELADEVVAVDVPDFFLGAVGAYYSDFHQVEDDEVMDILKKYNQQNN
ncbi:MAG: phosphoribosyltransferase family protein [Alkalibacterium sp.]|nr:phosphoribosyltransferase family protein [Alkalibacterium sp.]